MKKGHETPGRRPEPTEADAAMVDSIVKKHLGQQATGSFIGAMVRGEKGDNPVYAHAIVVVDPAIADHHSDFQAYGQLVTDAAQEIGNSVDVAGNVTLDITSSLLKPDGSSSVKT